MLFDRLTALQTYRTLWTAVLFWCGLVIVASNYLTIPLMTIFHETFHVSLSNIAWVGSSFSLCYAIGSLFSGPLSDRFGRKQVIFWGLVLLTIITFVIPLFQNLLWIIILRCFQGLAAASFAPVAIAFVVDKYAPEKMVSTIGFISSGFLISGIVGQLFSSYIADQFGWKFVFYYSGGIYLLTLVLVLLFLPKTDSKNKDSDWRAMIQQFVHLFKERKLIFAYTITITLLLTFVAFYTMIGDYLTEVFLLKEGSILYVRLVGILGMIFAPLAGILTNRIGLIKVLRGGLLLATFGIIITGWSSNLYFLVTSSVIFVTGIALTVPTLISLVGNLGGENRGAAVSLYAFILFVGVSLGPIVAVTILTVGNYLIAFSLLALILMVSLTISLLLKSNPSN